MKGSCDCLSNRRCGPCSIGVFSKIGKNRLKIDKKLAIVPCDKKQQFYGLKIETK